MHEPPKEVKERLHVSVTSHILSSKKKKNHIYHVFNLQIVDLHVYINHATLTL